MIKIKKRIKKKTEWIFGEIFYKEYPPLEKLFDELGGCNEDEQKTRIEEMNGFIDEMKNDEFKIICTIELLDEIAEMIEEKKMPLSNTSLLLKHMGYFNVLKGLFSAKTKNEICVPCLLKVAANKDESKETQKEVEMALLALSNVGACKIDKELYFREIKEIILYHQEHCNLSQLAYQGAAKSSGVEVDDLLKGGAIDAMMEEIQQPTLEDIYALHILKFFLNVSERSKEKTDNKMEKVKRKATKRKVCEKMEEEGYEDIITNEDFKMGFVVV
ncbi:uncharacterized protein MONOS_16887 [Monocercomonoides exilis]|uniref:uncharacterized protein n=1 Tax=Monocercomonoides exilis TaxID=2049356 RepID=UPI003559C8B3|nr:hypothetical protein MONOS_16887 [Monocercomonoides exilis]